MNIFGYVFLFFIGFVALDNLDKWGHAELLKQEQQQVKDKQQKVLECDTDLDCLEKNPQVGEY
jgi:hypothetical protein